MALDFSWQDGDRVLFLGDSLTENAQGYARLVPDMVIARYPERRITFLPRGMGGDRISELIGRLDRDVFDNDPLPNWISVSIGLNDVYHEASGTPIGRFRELYDVLLKQLLTSKARLLCLTTTVISEELESKANTILGQYNDAIREIAFANGAMVVDINLVFQDAIRRAQARNPDFHYTTDGMHLNNFGSCLMALTLLKALHFAL